MAVVASTATAVVLTMIAFLHGPGREPQAHSWVVDSIAECQAKAAAIAAELTKDPKVRSWKSVCIVTSRGENL